MWVRPVWLIILLTLKEKISVKLHLIDDPNEYKFIYDPGSSSREKRTFTTSAGFLRKFEPG